MKVLKAYDKAHEEQLKEQDMMNWYLGQYFADALLCTIGNSGFFHKKGAKPNEYPKRPYTMEIQEIREENAKELTEEEKIAKTKMLFAKLQIMASNNKLDKQYESNEGATE